MGDYSRMGDALGALIKVLAVTCLIFVPLGLWKLVDIVVWLLSHIEVV